MRKKTKKKPSIENQPTLLGTMRMHPKGFGFVIPENGTKDVFIPRHLTKNAVDGDFVKIAVKTESKSEKGPEGEVLAIVKRKRETVCGIIDSVKGTSYTAHVPILGENRPIKVKAQKKQSLQIGDRVLLKIIKWGDETTGTLAHVEKHLGHLKDPSIDVYAAVKEYDLLEKFPEPVLKEAKSFGESVEKKDLKDRCDLSKASIFTIDPKTAKDFDDALSLTKDAKGHFFLGVHIADVAHYVSCDSQLDIEAIKRGNSTYFPGNCIPMLPEELSNNLCSLKPKVIRLTVSVFMEFDQEGTLLSSNIQRSYIKSKKRFTYDEAKDVLDGVIESPYQKELEEMVLLCKLLKKKREERGSIDFALSELVILVDDQGVPTGVKIEEYHITHQLVEEFMLKANEVVAKTLSDQGKELLFRVHEEPGSENMEDFFSVARSLGFQLPPKPTPKDLQNVFKQASGTVFSQRLAISFIRTLKLAIYSPVNVGHYGLALEHYCHFTSPIRRYSDLVTQRILFQEQTSPLPLQEIGQLCSEKERISFRAELSVKLLKKYRLLKAWQEEDPTRTFPAYLTKIKPFGIFFELKELYLEGFLHISELENDYFIYNPVTLVLQGERTGKLHRIAEEIIVHPKEIDLIHLDTKWELVTPSKRKNTSSS